MNITLKTIPSELLRGLIELSNHLNVKICDDGYSLSAVQSDNSDLTVSLNENDISITYDKPHHFFRAFGLAVEHIKNNEKDFSIREKPHFDMNGPMFDLSQAAAAFNMKELKSIIRQLSLMGLNMLMLYTEDTYEVPEQPYFGYMRPKYTQAELKELDDYAYSLGIEMIPCIQTLSHMQEALKWKKVYGNITDYEACLLVGEEKTYDFLKDIIKAASAPFRSKKIHIGMDEAFNLGKGQFIDKFGYKTKGEIMRMHLDRVMEIVRDLGLEAMMWDDMFFSTFGNGKYRQYGAIVPEETKKLVPPDLRCVLWEYGGLTADVYDDMFRQHFELDKSFIFAGGIHAWMSYSLSWTKTKSAATAALAACKKYGVKNVFVTTWADHNAEILINVNLIGCQLYAELGYCDTLDDGAFEKRFKFCTGGNVQDFANLEYLDKTAQTEGLDNAVYYNTSKHVMWQDILTGLVDKNIEGWALNDHYTALSEKLKEAINRNGQFNGLFEISYLASHVLSLKAEMGIILTKAYREGDKETLKHYMEHELPELRNRVADLRMAHMKNWFEIYKPLGWDVIDLRYGGLISRIDTTIYELNAYLSGEFERLEEFEQERLPFDGIEGPIRYMNLWERLASPSKIVAKI